MMKKNYYSRIEKQIDSFPSLPSTVAEVMRVVSNPESSARDLTQAILPDQSMCVAILKIANSALYGRPKKVSSIETAIMVLGFNEVQNIVLSKSVIAGFSGIFKRNDDIIDKFWDHSFTSALAARLIAENFSINLPGRFFIGGLIHDIGKLAMLLTFPEEYPAEKWMTGFSTQEKLLEEKQTFGITHQEVAAKLLKSWNFPENLIEALEFHHEPENIRQNKGFAFILQVADALSYLCSQNTDEQEATDDGVKIPRNLSEELDQLLPGIEEMWRKYNLPWEEIRLEMWYNWLEIERKHGSSILAILSSK